MILTIFLILGALRVVNLFHVNKDIILASWKCFCEVIRKLGPMHGGKLIHASCWQSPPSIYTLLSVHYFFVKHKTVVILYPAYFQHQQTFLSIQNWKWRWKAYVLSQLIEQKMLAETANTHSKCVSKNGRSSIKVERVLGKWK